MYRTDFWTLWEKARVGCFKRTASKHVYYQEWNRSPAQVGCMRQVLGAGALGRPRGIWWRGRWEGGSGWGIHVNPWLIPVNVRQNPLQYCKVISLQLINGKKKKVGLGFSINSYVKPEWPFWPIQIYKGYEESVDYPFIIYFCFPVFRAVSLVQRPCILGLEGGLRSD